MLYVPVVKAKRGELSAIRQLDPSTRRHIAPFVEVLPPNPHVPKPKSLQDHLIWIAEHLLSAWPTDHFYIDAFDVPPTALVSGQAPIEFICRELRQRGLSAIPSTGFEREPEYDDAISRIISIDRRGLCVRLEVEDLLVPRRMATALERCLRVFRLAPGSIDLILDFRYLSGRTHEECAAIAARALAHIPYLPEWRTLVVTGSNMPNKLTDVCSRGDNTHLERSEWRAWLRLRNEGPERMPVFGDYATVPPQFIEVDPRAIAKQIGPNVKYTLERDWFIARGRSFHQFGSSQYLEIARNIVALRDFRGPRASEGERFIHDRGTGRIQRPGNPEQWITASVTSHITWQVLRLLSLQ